MKTAGPQKIVIPGRGAVKLSATDHIATGGEGMLYVKGGQAYKLFLDPVRARQHGMADKIQLLAQIRHPYIVAPTGVILDEQHNLIGYHMPAVAGESLVKSFSSIWWDETGFDDRQAVDLVYRMKEGVSAAHAAGALMVDGNEMNYLVQANEPRLIDVDSWQIDRFRPTAIMPSIRDYSTDRFSELSDWFGWGIVSFQVFTGTHPFKGTHPDFKRGDLEGRMRANASVFDPKVRLNAAVRAFDGIPAGLRDWYYRVFQQGRREAPPARFETIVTRPSVVTRKVRTLPGGGALKHDKIWASPGVIRHVSPNGIAFYESAQGRIELYDLARGQRIDLPAGLDGRRVISRDAVLVRAAGHFVWIELVAGEMVAQAVFGERDPRKDYRQRTPLPTQASRLAIFGNQPYALVPDAGLGLQELTVNLFGDKLVVSVGTQWPVLVKSTHIYQGVAVMDCLGVPFVLVPQPGQAEPVRAAALMGYRVIAGIAKSNSLVLVHALSRSDGQIYRLWLRRQGAEMVVADATPIDEPELSAAVNGRGVIVTVSDDGCLTLAAPGAAVQRDIDDAGVNRAMRLFSLGDGVAYVLDRDVFRLAMS